MRRRTRLGLLGFLSATLVAVAATAEAPPVRYFGAPPTLSEATPLADVLRAPETFTEKPILLSGTLVDVCQKKGCWTVLREGGEHIRIRFLGYGFFLPPDAVGARAQAEGVVTVKTISEDRARHYEEESRDGDPASIVGPQREVAFTASGVRLRGPLP